MYIKDFPQDQTVDNNGMVCYSEDGVHLRYIKIKDLLRGLGKGLLYWNETDKRFERFIEKDTPEWIYNDQYGITAFTANHSVIDTNIDYRKANTNPAIICCFALVVDSAVKYTFAMCSPVQDDAGIYYSITDPQTTETTEVLMIANQTIISANGTTYYYVPLEYIPSMGYGLPLCDSKDMLLSADLPDGLEANYIIPTGGESAFTSFSAAVETFINSYSGGVTVSNTYTKIANDEDHVMLYGFNKVGETVNDIRFSVSKDGTVNARRYLLDGMPIGAGIESVEVDQVQTSGVKIATIGVEGTETDLYAPPLSITAQYQPSGNTKLATLTYNGTSTDIYAPNNVGAGTRQAEVHKVFEGVYGDPIILNHYYIFDEVVIEIMNTGINSYSGIHTEIVRRESLILGSNNHIEAGTNKYAMMLQIELGESGTEDEGKLVAVAASNISPQSATSAVYVKSIYVIKY